MKLAVKMLDGDSTLNCLKYRDQLEFIPGETGIVMFQLVDSVTGIRYIPASGSIVEISMHSHNNANAINKPASQSFVDDRSIWSFNLNAIETSKMAGVNMTIKLTDGTNIKIARAESVIIMGPKSMFQC